MEQTYFRKGFGLKAQVKPVIDSEYHSGVVEKIRSLGYQADFGRVTVRLAQEFGFCYGVDRAVDYAYETVLKFPDRTTYLVGEIIHNPHVNRRMSEMGIQFIRPDADGEFDFSHIRSDDVVILPAFGVTLQDFETLKRVGCVLVDTTCGSVLVVWKRVEQYARDSFTAVIHGKYQHEESRATASQVNKHAPGRYLIVRDMAEAELVCAYIEGTGEMSRAQFIERFKDGRASPGFDPDEDLDRLGMANQTTMLAGESLMIGGRLKQALQNRHGEAYAEANYRAFDTLCSATQERQDAVAEMMQDPPDRMVVVGGYNSSNTNHLAHLCRQNTNTYHIDDAIKIDVEARTITHKPQLNAHEPEILATDWLPSGPFTLGITAGASTPNNKVGEAILRVLETCGVTTEG